MIELGLDSSIELFRIELRTSFLWEELSEKFRLLVDLLNEVSERALHSTNAGLIRLYERWLKTGSDRLATELVRQGVVPRKGFVQ